jgi:hypothetical protein
MPPRRVGNMSKLLINLKSWPKDRRKKAPQQPPQQNDVDEEIENI